MKELFVIRLSFNNPNPVVRYLGEQNTCNKPLKDAKRFAKEEAEEVIKDPILSRLNPKVVPLSPKEWRES